MPEPTPEELKKAEELKKKLESMTPEQLREFQKKNCIFCQISSGKVNAKKVYEDEFVVAILDINPANPGHVLLMPRDHHMILPQLPDELRDHIFRVTKKLSNDLLKALDARGTNIIVANGPAAGQRAQHFVVHIIPRKEGDGLQFTLPKARVNEMAQIQIADKVGLRLRELMGLPKESSPKRPQKQRDAENQSLEESQESREKRPTEQNQKKDSADAKIQKAKKSKSKVDLDDILKVLHG